MLRGCTRHGQILLKRLTFWQPCLDQLATGGQLDACLHGSLGDSNTHINYFASSSSGAVQPFSAFARHSVNPEPKQRPHHSIAFQTAQYASGPPDLSVADHLDQPDASSPAELDVPESDELESPAGMQRPMSLEEYDSVLDRWGELLQDGKLDEILDLMEYAYGGLDPLPPLEEMLATVSIAQ